MDSLTFGINVVAALALGVVIGLERELRHHEAGLRTNALVALGAALFVSLAQLIDHESSPTRIAGQVVSGIGFLAGGVIIRDGFSVRGMTTAATLWCTAAIGTLAGSGFITPATIGTGAVLALHLSMRPATLRLNAWAKTHARAETGYQIRVVCGVGSEAAVRRKLLEVIRGHARLTVLGLHGEPGGRPMERVVVAEIHATEADDDFVEGIVFALQITEGVLSAGWDRLTGRPIN